MSSVSQRPVGRRSTATVFYALALGSGIMRSMSVVFDVFALNLVDIDQLVFGFISQWISFLVTLALVCFLGIKHRRNGKRRAVGASLDPDFDRIRMLPRKPMIYLIIAGIFAGISTLFYYILVGSSDASTVLPYGQMVIIYLLIGDLAAEKDTPTIVEIQSIISILFGVLLIGAVPGGFDIISLLIVLGPLNISSALVTYYQRKTKRYEVKPGLRVDSLNMRVWSLLVLNSAMSLLALPMLPPDWTIQISAALPSLFWFMVGSSLTIFLSLVFYVRALGRGSMSVVNSLSAISVVLGLPITAIGNMFIPGGFGELTSDPFLWILKIFGVVLVMIGIVALQASDVRSIVLIRVKPKTVDILPDLFDIRGVQTAAALAGTHDYLLSIKSRTLAKTRTKILKRIQMIEGIEDIETLVVIKEYK